MFEAAVAVVEQHQVTNNIQTTCSCSFDQTHSQKE